jgi:hypothetical protein
MAILGCSRSIVQQNALKIFNKHHRTAQFGVPAPFIVCSPVTVWHPSMQVGLLCMFHPTILGAVAVKKLCVSLSWSITLPLVDNAQLNTPTENLKRGILLASACEPVGWFQALSLSY